MKTPHIFASIVVLCAAAAIAVAQGKGAVEVVPKIPPQAITKKCGQLQTGKIVFFQTPDYPSAARAARVGGTVTVMVRLTENGTMPEIESVSGNRLLQSAATAAAGKMKFTPTVCDGATVPLRVWMNYNFIPALENEKYTAAVKIEDFADVTRESEFYEAILDLTENYRIAYGFADRKFYPETPLSLGDFAHFLRLTLDLISERAVRAGKLPGQTKLFAQHNPQNLKSAAEIKKIGKNAPFADSVKILLLKYGVSLADDKKEFRGVSPVTQNQIVEVWTKIFGADAVPVNFRAEDGERLMTRGEFALFLQESLGVLTYKVLP